MPKLAPLNEKPKVPEVTTSPVAPQGKLVNLPATVLLAGNTLAQGKSTNLPGNPECQVLLVETTLAGKGNSNEGPRVVNKGKNARKKMRKEKQ